LAELLNQRPGALRWLVRQYLQPILGTAGDALPEDRSIPQAVALLLGWAISQLRPDGVLDLVLTDRQAWLERTSWRPAIALMCHYGFAAVPDFRDRYYRRPDESPAENLCGVWNIGPSTFYRYLEKGKRLAARKLQEQRLDRRHSLSIRQFTQRQIERQLRLDTDAARREWHLRQAGEATIAKDYLSALWHLRAACERDQIIALIQRHVADLAYEPELEYELHALHREMPGARAEIALLLAEAAVRRTQNAFDLEREAYETAMRAAVAADDPLAIGVIDGYLGKYYEQRDSDRAFAYYQDSAEFLQKVELSAQPEHSDLNAREEYVNTLSKLAWLYTLRNDPRARAVLDRADALHAQWPIGDEAVALLEQAWGEYWRRAGDLRLALEHKHRALNVYERLGDRQGVLKTYVNLGLIYTDLRNFDLAIDYCNRVLHLAENIAAGPEVVTSTHLNLGACYYWLGDHDAAISHYNRALRASLDARLSRNVRRSYFNLAEAYYTRFLKSHAGEDEATGDRYLDDARRALSEESDPAFAEAIDTLKARILGDGAGVHYDRLIATEKAAHPAEIDALERQRAILATPGSPKDHIAAHLEIARAYLAISAKEREAALALIDKHGLRDHFAGEFEQLRATYERGITREQRLAATWKAKASGLLNDRRRAAVLAWMIEREAINKSTYVRVCDVGPATASKHLSQLVDLGLLAQVGNGPSTRYVLA
jgi:tetratricopeptide (TPR) repeat protein